MSNGSRYSKKTFSYRKPKKENSRNEKRALERFGETRKRKGQDESDTGNKKQSKRCSSEVVGYLQEKLEQDRELR